jgi:xylulokinase
LTKDCVLGLDIGTQSVKGMLVDCAGNILASAALERLPQHPKPGWVEMDVERDWWDAALQVIQRLVALLPETHQLAAVGICGLVPCLSLIDKMGKPIAPAVLYSDNRALEELTWVNEVTGLELNAEAVVPKLVWFQRKQPASLLKTHLILSAHNYLVYRLTGVASMDYDTASIMGGIFDSKQFSWRTDRLGALGLPVAIWPELRPVNSIAGRITKAAAGETGLPAGVPVITGSGDTFPTMLGCGAVNPGDAMIAIGTTGLLTLTSLPLNDMLAGPHFEDKDQGKTVRWGANVLSAGRWITWFCDNFAITHHQLAEPLRTTELDLLEKNAQCIPAGSEGLIVLPHLLGRRTPQPDANLRGAILGLSPHHTSAHIYRAIMEAFAYNINQGAAPLRDQIKRLVLTAGGARSLLWRQIICNVLDMPVEHHARSSGALGIAFLTAFSLQMVDDFHDINQVWLAKPERISPMAKEVQIYKEYFSIYTAFDQAVTAPFTKLAAI